MSLGDHLFINATQIILMFVAIIYIIHQAEKKKQKFVNFNFSKVFWGLETILFAMNFTFFLKISFDAIAIIDLIGMIVSIYIIFSSRDISIERIIKFKERFKKTFVGFNYYDYEMDTDYNEDIDINTYEEDDDEDMNFGAEEYGNENDEEEFVDDYFS